jgi:hypothetical protein
LLLLRVAAGRRLPSRAPLALSFSRLSHAQRKPPPLAAAAPQDHVRRRLFEMTGGCTPDFPETNNAGRLTQASIAFEARAACLAPAQKLGLLSLIVVPLTNPPTEESLRNLLPEVFEAVLAAVALQGGGAAADALLRRLLPDAELSAALALAAP